MNLTSEIDIVNLTEDEAPCPSPAGISGSETADPVLEASETILRRGLHLLRKVDSWIEAAQRNNAGVDEVFRSAVCALRQQLNCNGVFLLCRDENLGFTLFTRTDHPIGSIGEMPPLILMAMEKVVSSPILMKTAVQGIGTSLDPILCVTGESSWDAVFLDIDGNPNGLMGAWYDCPSPYPAPDRLFLMTCFSEVLDNFIYSENLSALKQKIQNSIGNALKDRILNNGLTEALKILRETIDFNTLILLYHDEDDKDLSSLKYIVYIEGKGIFDPFHNFDRSINDLVRREGSKVLENNSRGLMELLVLENYHDEILITGIKKSKRIGKILISSATSRFDRFERDILDTFVSFIRQRVVDFNKEWRNLSKFFSVTHRTRLLESPGYADEFLQPKEEQVAILYADLSSFTMISEQILNDPGLIGQMIDIWAKKCLHVIWEHDGCFDKLVGDCVIALFGPPFYELGPRGACIRALQAATAISKLTRELYEHDAPCFSRIRESGVVSSLGVAVGINFAPLFVGMGGPNSDFTGFSSGMNNTARIQGYARKDEILVLQGCANQAMGMEGVDLDGPYQATLKNVAGEMPFWKLVNVPPLSPRARSLPADN